MNQHIPIEERSTALKFYYANLEVNRARARERAKANYYANKQKVRLRNDKYRKDNPEKWKLMKQKYHKRRFFFTRALRIAMRTEDNVEVVHLCAVLSRAWYNQRGRCAYTGKRLDRNAQVDHKTPTSRGGSNDASNLHWVTADANWVKGTMMHEDFMAICTDIAAYIESKKRLTSAPRSTHQ